MFFFRHPRPVVDGRTHAVQVVQQKTGQTQAPTVLVVDNAGGGIAAAPATDHPAVSPAHAQLPRDG